MICTLFTGHPVRRGHIKVGSFLLPVSGSTPWTWISSEISSRIRDEKGDAGEAPIRSQNQIALISSVFPSSDDDSPK